MNNVKRFDFTLTGHKNYQTYGSYVLAEDYDKLVEQVEKLRETLVRIKHRREVTDFCIDASIDKALEETC